MNKGGQLATLSLFAGVVFALGGCGGAARGLRFPAGSALRENDLTQELTFHSTVAGRDYGFAFPLLFNRTSLPVTIDGFAIRDLPPGVKITRYRAFSTKRFGYLIGSHIGDGTSEDYSRYPNLFRAGRTTIAPNSTGGLMFAVDLHVQFLGTKKVYATGCEVDYHLESGAHRSQALPCRFGFSKARQ